MKKIHHVGYVAEDIETFKNSFVQMNLVSKILDVIQDAKIELLTVGDGSFVELIQPLSPKAFTWNFMRKNKQGLHHICYEGYSLEEVEELITKTKMMKIRGPIPAILFNRDVIFAMTRSRDIIEFII